MKNSFLIWSIKHGAWWRANRRGYTESIKAAGRYSHEEAKQIVEDANVGGVQEAMIPDFATHEIKSAAFDANFHDVAIERIKQDRKWGIQNHHPIEWIAILGEEVGEACEAALRNDWLEFRREMIQIAAVAIAASESLDRNGFPDFALRCEERQK